ncbi:MAG: wax ester/triacylglycerol synthase domain-containing protein [bacterium]
MTEPPAPNAERLEADDAAILALESATIYGHTTKVLLLEPTPSVDRIRLSELEERVAHRVSALPRLTQRVEMRDGNPADSWWVADEAFDVSNHLTEHTGGPVDSDGLRKLVSEAMESRLDHAAPLWQIEVVHLTEGRTALIARFHHCMADGVSSVKILSGLFFDEPTSPRPARRSSTSPATRGPTGDAARPPQRRSTFETLRTLLRELTPSRKTPLARHISGSREVAWAEVSLERVKRIGKAAGETGTVNDVVLAAVGGSLDAWLAAGNKRPKRLKAQVPVSLHNQDEGDGIGNRDSFLFVDLPLGSPSPIERLKQINAETHERKTNHDAETLYDFFHAIGRFAPLHKASTRLSSGPREFALTVSNGPGPRTAAQVLGRPTGGWVTLAEPADRHAVRIAIISIGDRITFGVCSDPEAVEGTERIASGIIDALDQLELALN